MFLPSWRNHEYCWDEGLRILSTSGVWETIQGLQRSAKIPCMPLHHMRDMLCYAVGTPGHDRYLLSWVGRISNTVGMGVWECCPPETSTESLDISEASRWSLEEPAQPFSRLLWKCRETEKGGWAKWGMATVTLRSTDVTHSLLFVNNPVAPPQLWVIRLIRGNLHLTLHT